MEYVIVALYKFAALDNYEEKQEPLLQTMLKNDVKGTILLAGEGINGTISGKEKDIATVLAYLKSDERLKDLSCKISPSGEHAFYRTKVKLKKEIVTMGVEGIDPTTQAGTYLTPEEWNKLLEDPEVLLLDTRNDYEVKIGSFRGAVKPDIKSFREFPRWVEKNLDPAKHKKVAMFCTGGIRCEKSTAFLNKKGFESVFHLQGGILKYFEETERENSKWEGECFVFDQRVSVNQDLDRGNYDQCYACRMPLSPGEKESEKYEKGISCPNCYDKVGEDKKSQLAERARQIELAHKRGKKHIYEGKSVKY